MDALLKRPFFIAILGGILTAAPPPQSTPPRFEDFPVITVYRGGRPILAIQTDFKERILRCYADPVFGRSPESYARERVNFAGHFVISTCTCGTGCHYLYMWDATSGKFYQLLPPGVLHIGPFDTGGGRSVEYRGEQYRTNSSLLIVEGCVEDTCDCSKRYYQWTGSQFKLILRQPVPIPGACLKKSK
jgi:hypothetical protein